MPSTKRMRVSAFDEEDTKRAESTDYEEDLKGLQKQLQASIKGKSEDRLAKAAAIFSVKNGSARKLSLSPIKSTRFAALPDKHRKKRVVAKLPVQPTEESSDESSDDGVAGLDGLDFGFDLVPPTNNEAGKGAKSGTGDDAAIRFEALLSEHEAQLGRSLMSSQDGLSALNDYVLYLKNEREEQKQVAIQQITSAATAISKLNKVLVEEYGPKVEACLYNIKTSIGGHLHATDTLLADMNAAVDNVATDLHRLEAQIHAVKQKKVELLQEAVRGFQGLKKRHAAENQLVHQRLQELRERTREKLRRVSKESQAQFQQQFHGAQLLASQSF